MRRKLLLLTASIILLSACSNEEPVVKYNAIQVTSHNDLGEYFADVPTFVVIRAQVFEKIYSIFWNFDDGGASDQPDLYYSFTEGNRKISVNAFTNQRHVIEDTTINVVRGPLLLPEEGLGLGVFEDHQNGYGFLYKTNEAFYITHLGSNFEIVQSQKIDQTSGEDLFELYTEDGQIALIQGSRLKLFNSLGQKTLEPNLGATRLIRSGGIIDNLATLLYDSNDFVLSKKINLITKATSTSKNDARISGFGIRNIFYLNDAVYACYYTKALHSPEHELLVVYDFNGNQVFSGEYSNELYLRNLSNIGNSFLVTSQKLGNNVTLTMLDSNGSVLWSKDYRTKKFVDFAPYYHKNKVIESNGFLFLFFDNMRCIKIDSANGDVVWDRSYDLPHSQWENTILTKKGNFLMAGTRAGKFEPEIEGGPILIEITRDGQRIQH
ncbi:MAG: hypothetical protein RIB47_06905 [Cyclobacteriaceae bacterium]